LLPRLAIFLQKRIKCDFLGIAAIKCEIKNLRNVCSNICVILLLGKRKKLFQARVGPEKYTTVLCGYFGWPSFFEAFIIIICCL
jgi:hypothetical protein